MQYKLLHRCYATDSIISKWDNTKSELCVICNKKANILHNFVTCTKIDTFWRELETKYDILNIDKPCTITPNDILFGRFKQPKHDLFNHAMLYAKYFIHKHYVVKTNLSVNGFVSYYTYILLTEKQCYISIDKIKDFNFRFGKCALAKNLVI